MKKLEAGQKHETTAEIIKKLGTKDDPFSPLYEKMLLESPAGTDRLDVIIDAALAGASHFHVPEKYHCIAAEILFEVYKFRIRNVRKLTAAVRCFPARREDIGKTESFVLQVDNENGQGTITNILSLTLKGMQQLTDQAMGRGQ